MVTPKITIITVTYNCRDILEDTIISVINQNYSNIEYLVVDGWSTDGTMDIVKKYSDKITKWISEPDTGIYDAMNKGINMSSGEWIIFMNAGDSFVDNNTLDFVFEDIPTYNVKVVYGDCIGVWSDRAEKISAKSSSEISRGMICCHQSSFTRAEEIKNHKFDTRFKTSADYNLFYQIYLKFGLSAFLYKPLDVAYYDYTNSFSEINIVERKKENLIIRSIKKDLLWWRNYLGYIKLLIKISEFKPRNINCGLANFYRTKY